MEIVALYGRVSDKGRQGDNFSVGSQLDLMRGCCESRGWSIYIELHDEHSAFIDGMSRPNLQRIRDLAREGKITMLMYFSADRFTRDTADGVVLRHELWNNGIKLMCYYPSVTEVDPDFEVMNILTDHFNNMESKRRRTFAMAGVRKKVDEGLFPQGNAPYGYRLEGRKHDTRIVIYQEEGKIVSVIFSWYYYDNIGCEVIAQRLNERHIPTPGGAAAWTSRIVRLILKKKAYIGVWEAYTWQKVGKNKWIKRPEKDRVAIEIPAIVPAYLWNGVQERLSSRKAGRSNTQYLMSCRLTCSCGRRMSGKRNASKAHGGSYYYYYRCNSAHEKNTSCKNHYVPKQLVEDTVWQFAYEFIQDPEKLLRAMLEVQQEDAQTYDTLGMQLESLTILIAEREEELSSLVEQRTKTKIPTLAAILDTKIEEYAEAIEELKQRRDVLTQERLNAPFSMGNIDEVVSEIAELRQLYEALHAINQQADFEAKLALIALMDLKATVKGETLDIHYLRKTYSRPLRPQMPTEASRLSWVRRAAARPRWPTRSPAASRSATAPRSCVASPSTRPRRPA